MKEKKSEVTEHEQIVSKIISKAVMQVMETSYRADWRRIVGWVDKEVFSNTDVCDREQYDAAKKNSEHVLLALGVWYNEIYLDWNTEAFVNVPLGVETSGVFVQGEATIINLQSPVVCTHIDKNLYSTKKEYSQDIQIRGLAWLLSEHLKCDEVTMQCLSLGNRGRLDINLIKFDSSSLKRTATYINNMCRIIKKKYFYPAVSSDCINCKYYSKCNL
jgi:hypothetical protein